MHILIAGAGIGGLSAALCLHKSGYQVSVFERATEFSEIGAGLQCGANALRVFEYLDLLDDLKAVAVAPEGVHFRDYLTGEDIYYMDLGDAYADKYGAPYWHVHRADLHGLLVKRLQQVQPNALHMGAGLQGFTEDANSVTVTLSDGRSFTGDCLIGADGIRSKVRDQLLGEQAPRFTGNVAWRAVVPVNAMPADWMATVTSNFIGPGKHAVLYYLRQRQLANLVGVVENPDWNDDSWTTKAPWHDLKADFAGWHPTVQAIVDAVDKDQCYRWALYDHAPLENWSSARVTLLGDAAHATLPFMAAGAAMAIEDGRILQRSLQSSESVSEGLQCYQRNRMPRTVQIQRDSRRMGRFYHIESRMLQRAAFKAIGLFGGRNERFLPEYDANTVMLS